MVLSSGLPILIYPWDTFLKTGFSEAELKGFGASDAAEQEGRSASATLAARLLFREMRHFATPEACLGDAGAVAAAILSGTENITSRRLHVAMELQGTHTRGMTVCDIRGFVHPPDEPMKSANADVIMDVKVSAIKDLFSRWVLSDRASPIPTVDRRMMRTV